MAGKVKSTQHFWPGQWDPEQYQKGAGLIGEGQIVHQRFHIETCKANIHRYTVLVLKIDQVFRRTFDKYLSEVIPDFTGKNPTAANANKVSNAELLDILGAKKGATVPLIPGITLEAPVMALLHPTNQGHFEFWGDADMMKTVTMKEGESCRFFTKGDSLFLQKIAPANANFHGQDNEVLLTQISQVSDAYADVTSNHQGAHADGVDDDEWDD